MTSKTQFADFRLNDPIAMEVFTNRLLAIADEIAGGQIRRV